MTLILHVLVKLNHLCTIQFKLIIIIHHIRICISVYIYGLKKKLTTLSLSKKLNLLKIIEKYEKKKQDFEILMSKLSTIIKINITYAKTLM